MIIPARPAAAPLGHELRIAVENHTIWLISDGRERCALRPACVREQLQGFVGMRSQNHLVVMFTIAVLIENLSASARSRYLYSGAAGANVRCKIRREPVDVILRATGHRVPLRLASVRQEPMIGEEPDKGLGRERQHL